MYIGHTLNAGIGKAATEAATFLGVAHCAAVGDVCCLFTASRDIYLDWRYLRVDAISVLEY
jgi:hypothetical protein